jgi:hypothetical protein
MNVSAELIVAYINGAPVEYFSNEVDCWIKVFPYESSADIIRLGGNHNFRLADTKEYYRETDPEDGYGYDLIVTRNPDGKVIDTLFI